MIQRSGDADVVLDVTAVIVAKSKKPSHISNENGYRPFSHRFNFLGIRANSLGAHDVSKVGDLRLEKLTLLGFEFELTPAYPHQHLQQVGTTFLHCLSDNYYVIDVGKYVAVLDTSQ